MTLDWHKRCHISIAAALFSAGLKSSVGTGRAAAPSEGSRGTARHKGSTPGLQTPPSPPAFLIQINSLVFSPLLLARKAEMVIWGPHANKTTSLSPGDVRSPSSVLPSLAILYRPPQSAEPPSPLRPAGRGAGTAPDSPSPEPGSQAFGQRPLWGAPGPGPEASPNPPGASHQPQSDGDSGRAPPARPVG